MHNCYRYWCRETSDSLARIFMTYNRFPEKDSSMFDWPADLTKPTAIYYLVDEPQYWTPFRTKLVVLV